MNTETSFAPRWQWRSSRKTQQTLHSLHSLQEEVQALRLQITRMEKFVETRQQDELKPRRQPPPGKTAMQMIQGQWPGEETTEQLLAQLKALR